MLGKEKMKASRLVSAESQLVEDGFAWDFCFDNGRAIRLTEKPDWPVLFGQPIESVEAWLVREYGWAIDFFTIRKH